MTRRRHTAILPSTPCSRCRRLESKIRAVVLSVVHFPLSGIQKCSCGTIATMFSQASGRDSQEDNCMLSAPLSTIGLHYSRWQGGGICQVLSTEAFTLFCHDVHGIKEGLLSFFVTLVLVSCSRVCLLVVSRLLGQTLRHFPPVCYCHQDSLTRGRLAFEQEAVRVSSSLSFHLFFEARCAL